MHARLLLTRIVVAVLAAGGFFIAAGMLFGFLLAPQSGIDRVSSGTSAIKVTRVEPGSAAARSGISAGDILRFATQGDQIGDAFARPGTVTHFVAPNGRTIALTYEAPPLPIGQALRLLAQALLGALAMLILIRAWHDEQARRLAVLFAVLSNYATDALMPTPLALLYLAPAWMFGSPWGILAFARFGTGFPSTPAGLRRALRIAAGVIASLYFLVLVALVAVPSMEGAAAGCWAAVALAGLAGLIASYGNAAGQERRRILWVLVSFGLGLGPIALYELYVYVARVPETWTWQAIPLLILPIGMTYATLRHRVIDVGFALTRAGVFSVMMLLVAGLFGVLESIADKYFSAASHTESTMVELAITLIVVYAMRYFHEHVEHAIEEVVFAARRRRIKLIVSIADAFGIASAPEGVTEALVRGLRQDANISSAVYVEENGVLRHEAGDASLDPAASQTVHAFPLETFQRERGKLVCELGADGEFAPDEAEALTKLARDAAIARESKRVDALEAELASARAFLGRLRNGETDGLHPGNLVDR